MLVLRYAHDRLAREFSFVCEAEADRELGAHRAFQQFVFSGVKNYRRVRGGHHVEGGAFIDKFELRQVPGATSVDKVDVHWPGSAGDVRISMGDAFGAVQFGFTSVFLSSVQLKSVGRQGDDWIYVDVATDQVVDFYRPFR